MLLDVDIQHNKEKGVSFGDFFFPKRTQKDLLISINFKFTKKGTHLKHTIVRLAVLYKSSDEKHELYPAHNRT